VAVIDRNGPDIPEICGLERQFLSRGWDRTNHRCGAQRADHHLSHGQSPDARKCSFPLKRNGVAEPAGRQLDAASFRAMIEQRILVNAN
jgi:hypothetical protein